MFIATGTNGVIGATLVRDGDCGDIMGGVPPLPKLLGFAVITLPLPENPPFVELFNWLLFVIAETLVVFVVPTFAAPATPCLQLPLASS